LPRPLALDEALAARDADPAGYAAVLRQSVADVVRQQADLGIDVVGDGEFGKSSWTGYLSERLGGFEAQPISPGATPLAGGQDRVAFADFYAEATRAGRLWYRPDGRLVTPAAPMQWVCTAPITYTGQAALLTDLDNMQAALAAVPGAEGFMPVAAPASVEPGRRNDYYATAEEYLFALAEALRVEYETIVAAGLLLQVDDAWITALWDRMLPTIDVAEYRAFCTLRIDALNHALRNIPSARVRYHICWGSWHGPHSTDIPLADVVDLMLRVNADTYLFEAGNVRHEHEYGVWDQVGLPAGKTIVPGVVSHATNVLEHPDLVAQRLDRYAQRVGRAHVMAGTDCGLGGRVHPQLAWAKLAVMVEGAERSQADR
jgi:5-methyltetrahydropteroyltriglutamate--homocysteine methyltransferase